MTPPSPGTGASTSPFRMTGAVRGMPSYDSLFGYLACGWTVFLAKASTEHSARYGLDFDAEPFVHPR